ncbi:MAG: hypothetical protein FJ095_16305 [Deltaproteobacteria bacterium]|nr:hypothetical protein [Deltaproteobacteria bacterium]
MLHAQHTRRARLEFHPELASTPYVVSFGLVGRQLAPASGVDPDAWSHAGAPHGKDCEFLGPNPATGHYVCGKLLASWKSHGVDDASLSVRDRSIRLFGYPISPPVAYQGRTVQWFERARLELHPENKAPFDVLGGLLGCEASGSKGWGCQPKPAPLLARPRSRRSRDDTVRGRCARSSSSSRSPRCRRVTRGPRRPRLGPT